MPVIPAWLVRSNLNDPRRVPYLLVWKDERHDGETKDGDAGLALNCATLPKAAICVQPVSGDLGDSASCFALMETCHGQSRGCLTSLPAAGFCDFRDVSH
jgi:hypothetical protein